MEIKVLKKANSKIVSSHKVTARFMDGDADGYGDDSTIISESDLKDEASKFKNNFKSFSGSSNLRATNVRKS